MNMNSRYKTTAQMIEEFDTTRYVSSEHEDLVTYWMLKALLKLGGHKKLINVKNSSFLDDDIACFLGFGHLTDVDEKHFIKRDMMKSLTNKYQKLENKKTIHKQTLLDKNIDKIGKLLGLSQDERAILKFVILVHQVEILQTTIELTRDKFTSRQTIQTVAELLDIPIKRTTKLLSTSSKLYKTTLVNLYESRRNGNFTDNLETISDIFAENMNETDGDVLDIIDEVVRKTDKAELTINDYKHIRTDVDILVKYMRNATKNQTAGANVLLYGIPGTGKTQLAKTVAKVLGKELYEVSYIDKDGDSMACDERTKAYKIAQAMLTKKDTILLYDEAEDIFDSDQGSMFARSRKQDNKAWINNMLETNDIPTIWITNDIDSIDNAIIRRFDINIKVPIPNKSQRVKILTKYSHGKLDKKTIEKFATHEHIAPSIIGSTTKVIESIKPKQTEVMFERILNNTLSAQGYKKIQKHTSSELPQMYDTSFINTTADIQQIATGIKQSQNARICLYGVPGTGKSAFGRYIAKTLDKQVVQKKVSDLQSQWIGVCEKNIASAFEEAAEQKAVLVFDEVDTFLSDRAVARQSFVRYCKLFKIKKPDKRTEHMIKNLTKLTPGDFKTIERQSRFRPITHARDLYQRIEDEIKLKEETSKTIGFCRKI